MKLAVRIYLRLRIQHVREISNKGIIIHANVTLRLSRHLERECEIILELHHEWGMFSAIHWHFGS